MIRPAKPPATTQVGFAGHQQATTRVASVHPSRIAYALRWFTIVAVTAVLIAVGLSLGIVAFDTGSTAQPLGVVTQRTASANLTPKLQAVRSPTTAAGPVDADTAQSVSTFAVRANPLPTRSSRLIAQEPERVLDTRDGQPLTATDSLVINVDGDRTAVALSVSVMGSANPGAVLIDGGAGVVEAATIARPGLSTTNLIVVPLVGNQLTVRSSTGGHLMVDVVGAFEHATSATAGRFIAGPPNEIARLVTETDGRELTLPFSPSAPRGQASAVLVAITADVGAEGGVIRFGPTEGAFDQVLMWGPATEGSKTRRGLALVQPSAEALTHLRYDGGSVLTAEVVGYFTNESRPSSTDGLYVPTGPRRIFDGLLQPEASVVVDDIEPSAATALITVDSDVMGAGTLGSFLVPAVDGSLTLSSESTIDIDVSLLGVFLAG